MKTFVKYVLKTAGGLLISSVLSDIIDNGIKVIKKKVNTEKEGS